MEITSPTAPSLLRPRRRATRPSHGFPLKALLLAVTLLAALLVVLSCRSAASGQVIHASDWWWLGLVLGLMVSPFYLFSGVEPTTAAPRGMYLPTLDGWRAIAIGLVILDHTTRSICESRNLSLPLALIHGQHGVNLFFAISGLLITWKLLEEREQTGSISLAGFYRRRVYRILPAAFAYLCVVGLLSVAGGVALRRIDLAATVLYFRNFLGSTPATQATGHFWSLSIEEQFYLVLPALLLLLGTRWFQSLAVVLISACAAWRWWFFQWIAPQDAPITVRFRTDIRIDGLLCGCLIAIVLSDPRAREFLRKILTTPVWLGLLAVIIVVIHRNGEYTTLPESMLFPVLLAGTLLAPRKLAAHVLEVAPLRWIGRISYSLYLWQQLFLMVHSEHWLLSSLQKFPVNLMATIVCATLSYYCVERPMLRRAHARSTFRAIAAEPILAETTA